MALSLANIGLPHDRNSRIVGGLIALLGGGVFAWDITTPLGQVPWLLYVPIMLLTLWIPHRRTTFIVAGVFSLLIVLDHFLSPPGVGPRISTFNRSLGIFTIWIVAALLEVWKRTEHTLEDSRDQLRALSARLQSIREEEQTRLAREVHDELGQSLTGLQLGLTWLGEKLDPHQHRLQEKVTALLAILGATIQSVQRISAVLRPAMLDDLGLIAAMEWQARVFENHTGIPCAFSSNIGNIEPDRTRATAVFRILQESLTNVARHAGATRVTVSFTLMEQVLVLVIQDNGKGIVENAIFDHRSFGLIGMRERAHACGGDVSVHCPAHGGTVVTARIPLPNAGQA
mgnify:FL=1